MSRVLTGKWRWNDYVYPLVEGDTYDFPCEFESNERKIVRIIYGPYTDIYGDPAYQFTYDAGNELILVGSVRADEPMHIFNEWRIMDFGEGYDVDDYEHVEWLLSNITRYGTIAEKMEQIAENEQKVYDAGYQLGYNEGKNNALPIEVSTEAEMTALLESGEVGGVYKYTGESGTYENDALYVLEEETKGYTVTINFEQSATMSQPNNLAYLFINEKFGTDDDIVYEPNLWDKGNISPYASMILNDVSSVGVTYALRYPTELSQFNNIEYSIDGGAIQTSSGFISITSDCALTLYMPYYD